MGPTSEIDSRTETALGITVFKEYEYDTSGRLKWVDEDGIRTEEFTYDSNNNRITITTLVGTETAVYDDQDHLLAHGTNIYNYTENGEVSQKLDSTGLTNYTYDTQGSLESVLLPDGTLIEYLFDARNRRIGKLVDGVFYKGWLYKDELSPVAELDSSGAIELLFVYGAWPHVPDYVIRSNGDVDRLVTDRIGSVRLVVSVATGQLVARREYSAFGEITVDNKPSLIPFGFAGGLYDEHTGLTHFGAREYDAEVGRWTSKDPSFFAGGLNFYEYARSNPIRYIDPNGKATWDTITSTCTNHPGLCATAGLAIAGGTALLSRSAAGRESTRQLLDTASECVSDSVDWVYENLDPIEITLESYNPHAAAMAAALAVAVLTALERCEAAINGTREAWATFCKSISKTHQQVGDCKRDGFRADGRRRICDRFRPYAR